jgi:glycosyltransferase involved in cell wall biosynthesis
VAVLVPALDEERALPAVLDALPREGPTWSVREVVVVDNGSRDATADVARARGATVVLEPRRGYGAACLAGLAYLKSNPPEVVAFLDADGSDDPAELERLLAPLIEDRAELVVGSRRLGASEPGALTRLQAFGNHLASALLRASWGAEVTDLGPYRAVRWDALQRLGMRDCDYGWTVEMQARALRAGLRVVEVAVSSRRRRAGRSKVSGTLRGTAGAALKILVTIARVRLGG